MNKPILDPRTKEDLMDLIQRRAGEYVPEWRYEQGDETDPGAAIATLFGEMFYQTIDRFNLLPQKHYTEFLNLLGVPGPGVTPACGLVRFEASGDGGPVPVPAGTEIFAAAQEEDGTDTALDRVLLQQLMEILDSREKKIVVMRYFRDKTQSEIAAYLGISQVQVSRLENRIMEKLRERARERAQ